VFESGSWGENDRRLGKLHSDEHRNLYSSPHIIKVVEASVGWAENVACVRDLRNYYIIW
jgi:hypothetical protein